MINAICKEIVLQKDFFPNRKISYIYFGGGTPSLLNKFELEEILATINVHFDIQLNAEITLEANPEDLIPPYLQILKNAGINRLSIGIQVLDDQVLT